MDNLTKLLAEVGKGKSDIDKARHQPDKLEVKTWYNKDLTDASSTPVMLNDFELEEHELSPTYTGLKIAVQDFITNERTILNHKHKKATTLEDDIKNTATFKLLNKLSKLIEGE